VIGITILGSGSRGNALVVHGESGDLLLDVGFSAKETRRRMAAANVDEKNIAAILVSHEHRDHVTGLRVLARQLGVPVYMNRLTAMTLKDRQEAPEQVHVFTAGTPFQVGALRIEPFTIPHDAVDPVGFAVHNAKCKLTVATDLGHASSVVKHHLLHADLIVLESNHEIALLHASDRPWALKQRILSRHGHLQFLPRFIFNFSRFLKGRQFQLQLPLLNQQLGSPGAGLAGLIPQFYGLEPDVEMKHQSANHQHHR